MKIARKLLLGAAFSSLAVSAFAADLPSRTLQATAPTPVMDWSGFYVGATTGYNFFTNVENAAKPNGALLGLRAGYDFKVAPDFTLGLLVDGEIDFGKKSYSGTYLGTPYSASIKQTHTVSVDVKAGYLLNDTTMLYALGGYTHSEIKASATLASYSASVSVKGNGWNIGAGAEYRFTKEWSGFGEYRFNQVKKDGVTIEVSQVKAGVAYRF